MICGWCRGAGVYEGKKCVCSVKKKPFFPKKNKKKNDDTLPSGHRHGNDQFLYETSSAMFFTCNCGHTHKVSL